MSAGRRTRLLGMLAAVPAVSLGIAACGSSSSSSSSQAASDPQTLINEVFSSHNQVKSGVLRLVMSATLKGSAEVTTPVTLGFDGPFTESGSSTPQSSFTIDATALGHTGTFGLVTTGSSDYLTLEGKSYTLPASKVGSLTGGSSSSGSLPGLSSLGIQPAHWLTHPRIVSTPTVDGVTVDRIAAGVDVPAFIADVNTLLAKEAKTSSAAKSAGVSSISAATARKIAAAVRNPTVQVDVGRSDHILRALTLHLTIPVTGTTSTELGGATAAQIALTTRYTDINQPQTITAPAQPRSYAQLKSRINTLAAGLLGAVGTAEGTTTSGSGTTKTTKSGSVSGVLGTGSTGTASSSRYANCINSANGDVAKMQKCASLLK
jgi:hypothetical protein